MEPFTLLMKIGSPIAMPKNGIHLDGLLALAIARRWDLSDYEEIHRTMKEYLAFDEKYGVYQCSAMSFVVTDDIGITLRQRCRPDDLRNKMSSDYFDNGRSKKIRINGGPTKKRMTVRPTHFAPYITFTGIGKPSAIKDLLVSGVGGIGSDCNTSAGGEIRDITILPAGFNYIGDDGMPVRNLPAIASEDFDLDSLHQEPVTLISPYYLKPKQHGYKPERIKVNHLNSILGEA